MPSIVNFSAVSQLVQGFNWHTPSWDLFIILVWGLSSVLYAFAAGRGRIISLLMSIYIAKLLVLQAPWLASVINQRFPGTILSLQELVSFLLIFIVLFILLSRYAFRTAADSRFFSSVPFNLVFSVLQIGLLINTILSYLALSGKGFSPLVTLIFISGTASFIWLLLPLVFLIVLGRSVADPTEV